MASIINKDREIVTEVEATIFRQRFFELYPVIRAWHHEVWTDVNEGKITEVRTGLGHRRKFSPNMKEWQVAFATLNYSIQGGCAEALKFCVKELYGALPQGARIVALLHDEIVLECDSDDAQAMLHLTIETMEEIASIIFERVHMKAEGSIRDCWG